MIGLRLVRIQNPAYGLLFLKRFLAKDSPHFEQGFFAPCLIYI